MLITGGTGGIGGHLARWLADGGAGQVVLASRRGPAADGVALLAARVAGRDAHARVTRCDVTDRDQLTRVVAGISTGRHRLTTVMHTAAVLDDGVIDGLDVARLAAVAAPKVSAVYLLEEVTAGLDLDAFVVFSSMAATCGQWRAG